MQHFLSDAIPKTDEIESALLDFGFYHRFSDVARMYAELVNRGRYGYEGGVLDQPDEYWSDMATMKWLEFWVKYVAPAPRMEQVSVFDRLRENGQFSGKWLGGGND